mmetsp:Transcript_6782/g.27682  ORF Transcript_6782/g.27682 Transcript_6782/m.27682 type:complete len:201 (+) Transcript_6782:2594-3196(+)
MRYRSGSTPGWPVRRRMPLSRRTSSRLRCSGSRGTRASPSARAGSKNSRRFWGKPPRSFRMTPSTREVKASREKIKVGTACTTRLAPSSPRATSRLCSAGTSRTSNRLACARGSRPRFRTAPRKTAKSKTPKQTPLPESTLLKARLRRRSSPGRSGCTRRARRLPWTPPPPPPPRSFARRAFCARWAFATRPRSTATWPR